MTGLSDNPTLHDVKQKLARVQAALSLKTEQADRLLVDVNESHLAIDLLEHDSVTSLYSARGFVRRADMRIRHNPGASFDVISLEVGGIGLVNEVYGYQTGNQLLHDIGQFMLKQDAQGRCVLGRTYTSVFCLLAPTQIDFGPTLLANLKEFLRAYPLQITFAPRMGVYSSGGEVLPVEQMLERARLAKARAGEYNGWVCRYERSVHDDIVNEHRICDRVPQAIRDHELRMYLQPKVDMRDGRIVGAEALVRWQHPELGFLSPFQFIPLLERRGLIYDVDAYMWDQICDFQAERCRRGQRVFPVSVNVARGDLYQDDLVDRIDTLVAEHHLPQDSVRFEILERAYVRDEASIGTVLRDIRAHGFKVEMDDFGTGESSLGMLADMEVDVLKLDRSFLRSGLLDRRSIEVIRAVVQLAHALDMDVIAEGVEHEHQRDTLLDLGCNYAQGYLYYKPQPWQDFADIE